MTWVLSISLLFSSISSIKLSKFMVATVSSSMVIFKEDVMGASLIAVTVSKKFVVIDFPFDVA